MPVSWFSMDNLIGATLSGLFVSVVGAWIIKRFMGGGETSENVGPAAQRPISRSVHVRIDSDFLKTSFTIFCIIALSIYIFVQGPDIEEALNSKSGALNAALQPQGDQVSNIPAPPIVGDPVRVNFAVGSYEADVTVSGSTRYLLWAKAGQIMKLATVKKMPDGIRVIVYSPNGNPVLPDDPGMYALPISGDYAVDVVTFTPFVLRFSIY